jgi:hypothetical protein
LPGQCRSLVTRCGVPPAALDPAHPVVPARRAADHHRLAGAVMQVVAPALSFLLLPGACG